MKQGPNESLKELLHRLYRQYGLYSILVEGGRAVLRSFLSEGLYDQIHQLTGPQEISKGLRAPVIPAEAYLTASQSLDMDRLAVYTHPKAPWATEID